MEEIEREIALVLYHQEQKQQNLDFLKDDLKKIDTTIIENKKILNEKLSSKGGLARFRSLSMYVGAKIVSTMEEKKILIKECYRSWMCKIQSLYEGFKKKEQDRLSRRSELEKVSKQLEQKKEVLAEVTESTRKFSEIIQSFAVEEGNGEDLERVGVNPGDNDFDSRPRNAGFVGFLDEQKEDFSFQTNILKMARMNSKRMLKKVDIISFNIFIISLGIKKNN